MNKPTPDRRWLALAVIGVAQLMIVLDASIVNIALPHAQAALHISDAQRQWALTAYTLTFGGLLLLGGRIADYLGRKRTFLLGLFGFAGASAPGGLALLVYGFTEASVHGWTAPLTLTLLAVSVVLLGGFVAWEQRAKNPMLPLRIVLDRTRGGAYLAFLLATMGLFATFLFLTY